MRYVPDERKREIYLLLISKSEVSVESALKRIHFESHHQKRQLLSAIRKTRGVGLNDNGNIAITDIERCPLWVRYFLYIKDHPNIDTFIIAKKFNKAQPNVLSELYRLKEHLNVDTDSRRYTFALKEGLV